jgi:hypothetical protein
MKSASALVVPKLFMSTTSGAASQSSACRQQPSVTFERMQPHLQRFRHGVEIENIPPACVSFIVPPQSSLSCELNLNSCDLCRHHDGKKGEEDGAG